MRWIRPLVLALAFASVLLVSAIEIFFVQTAFGRFLTAHAAVVAMVLSIFVPGVALWYFGFAHAHRKSAIPGTTSSKSAASLPAIRMDSVDREFLPAALELFETPPSPVKIAAIWLICATFATALAWSYFGWLEIYAVAQGRIQPSGRSKIVQSLDPGKVVAIAVENGRRVAAGELLIELDPRETAADRQEQHKDLESACAEAARRRVAIAAALSDARVPPIVGYPEGTENEVRGREDGVLAADIAQLVSNKASILAQRYERLATRNRLKASIEAREKLIAVDKEHVEMRELLNQTKVASRAQVIETLQQYHLQTTIQAGEQGQLAESEAAILTLDRKLEEITAQFVADQTQKLAEALRKADHLKEELVKASTKHERTRIAAPLTGTVQQLAVNTVGQVVSQGQALMTIVPFDAAIEIEALVQNQDIGFIELGQTVVVKIESFPFTRYGTVDGTVTKVSRDAVDEREASALSDPKSSAKPQSFSPPELSRGQNLVFPATIVLAKNTITVEGKAIPLSPGMAVTVEVLTGRRRAIDYLLSPLREVASSSARER
jgi:hemolysin D